MAATLPRLSAEDVDALKRRYDPELVDTLVTQLEGADVEAAYRRALEIVLAQGSEYDRLAIERRTHEAALIKEEVRMFNEIGTLLGSIRQRYEALTGTGSGA